MLNACYVPDTARRRKNKRVRQDEWCQHLSWETTGGVGKPGMTWEGHDKASPGETALFDSPHSHISYQTKPKKKKGATCILSKRCLGGRKDGEFYSAPKPDMRPRRTAETMLKTPVKPRENI